MNTLTVFLGLTFAMQGVAFAAHPTNCKQPDDWHTRADANRDRVYANRNGNVYLFEYTPEGDGGTLEGNPFWVSLPVERDQKYNLSNRN